MPQFTTEILNVLKAALATTAPDYRFTDDMLDGITGKMGLSRDSVVHWAKNIRWKMNIGFITDITAFLAPGEQQEVIITR
jgi:hypothetical protein